jgi:hypothetical protein
MAGLHRPHSPSPHLPDSVRLAPSPRRIPPPPVSPKSKDKSPLRHSFRNILSLLKEKKPKALKPSPIHKDLPAPPAEPSSRGASQSGTLIYLIPTTTASPVWATSTVLLHDGKITVSVPEDEYEISLEGCTDIRSIALDALDPKSVEALSTDDLKVFEILFERKPRQVFAVHTVRGRAKWISAFWSLSSLPRSSSSSEPCCNCRDAVLYTKGAEERGRKAQLTRDMRWKKARFSNVPSDDEDDRSPSPLSMRYRGKHHSAPTVIGMDAMPPILTKRDRSLPPLPSSRLHVSGSTTSVDHKDQSPPNVEMSRSANSSTRSVYSIPDLPTPVTLQPQLQSRSRSGSGTRPLRVKNKLSSSAFSYTSADSSSSLNGASTRIEGSLNTD